MGAHLHAYEVECLAPPAARLMPLRSALISVDGFTGVRSQRPLLRVSDRVRYEDLRVEIAAELALQR